MVKRGANHRRINRREKEVIQVLIKRSKMAQRQRMENQEVIIIQIRIQVRVRTEM